MPRVYMLRNPGRKDYGADLAHLREGTVADVSKDDFELLTKGDANRKPIAEEFDSDNETHAAAPAAGESKGPAVMRTAKAQDYNAMTVEDLHAEATKRNLEGRSGLDKAGLVKALEKDDRKGAK